MKAQAKAQAGITSVGIPHGPVGGAVSGVKWTTFLARVSTEGFETQTMQPHPHTNIVGGRQGVALDHILILQRVTVYLR